MPQLRGNARGNFSDRRGCLCLYFAFRFAESRFMRVEMKAGRQGRLFRVRLSEHRLTLWLCGFIPVGWVNLKSIEGIQQRGMTEFWSPHPKRIVFPWRYWFWPTSPGVRPPRSGTFQIRTHHGTRIWVKLRSGLHYQLREAVHRSRTGLE